jgi:hypothetical protein
MFSFWLMQQQREFVSHHQQLDLQVCTFLAMLWAKGEDNNMGSDVSGGSEHRLLTRHICPASWNFSSCGAGVRGQPELFL